MNVPEFFASDRAAWRKWLERHHDSEDSVWLVYEKGNNRMLSYDDIVEEALCFGWIDSRIGSVDETKSKVYMSKRRPKSPWSESNKIRIAKLRKLGLMQQAGEDAIKIAKQNGQWNKN